MRAGDVAYLRSRHTEGTIPMGDLAAPLGWRWRIPDYQGAPIHMNGYVYWTVQGEGIVRARGHQFDAYEVVRALEEVPTWLAGDVANGLIYWQSLLPEAGPDPVAERGVERYYGILVHEGHRLIKWDGEGGGLWCGVDGLAFGKCGRGAVGLYEIGGSVRWRDYIEMEVERFNRCAFAVSRHYRRAVLLDTEYKLHGWDVDSGERLFQVRLADHGLARHFHARTGLLGFGWGQRLELGEGEGIFANKGFAIYDDLAIANIQHSVIVALDTVTGNLVWSTRGGGQQLVTDDGRVLLVRRDPRRNRVHYRELDARTGKTLVAVRNCWYHGRAGEADINPAESFGVYGSDATRTHCWVTGAAGSCYAINRSNGVVDWWWQDRDDYGSPFDILVWEGALFLYGMPLAGPGGPRMHVFEPSS